MTVQAAEYKSVVGVDSVYIAQISADTAAAYTAGTPEYLAPIAEVSLKPKTSVETQYADDQAYDTSYSEAESDLELTITNLPPEMSAKLLGNHFDTATGTVDEICGTPPYFAVGYRSMKSNGKYRYYWCLKVQFSAPEEGAQTKADKATPKTVKLVGKVLKTIYKFTVGSATDGVKRKWGDADTTNFSATSWFTQVQVPGTTAPSALALSASVPADDEGSASKTADLTLTFNNALQAKAINNITLVAGGAVVAATVTLDATAKIATINPTSSLAGATAHELVYAVEDIYGQTLTGVVTFTTVA